MKSDVVIAMGVGFIIGTVVAIGATNLPKFLTSDKKGVPTLVPTMTSQYTPPPQNDSFTLDSPADESIWDSKTVTVSGRARTGTNILIETEADTKVIEATDSGIFEVPIKIVEGSNSISITNFDANGEISTLSRAVYYTPEDL